MPGAKEKERLEKAREREQRGTYDDYYATPMGYSTEPAQEFGVDAFGRSLELKRRPNNRNNHYEKRQRGEESYNSRFRDRDSDDE